MYAWVSLNRNYYKVQTHSPFKYYNTMTKGWEASVDNSDFSTPAPEGLEQLNCTAFPKAKSLGSQFWNQSPMGLPSEYLQTSLWVSVLLPHSKWGSAPKFLTLTSCSILPLQFIELKEGPLGYQSIGVILNAWDYFWLDLSCFEKMRVIYSLAFCHVWPVGQKVQNSFFPDSLTISQTQTQPMLGLCNL